VLAGHALDGLRIHQKDDDVLDGGAQQEAKADARHADGARRRPPAAVLFLGDADARADVAAEDDAHFDYGDQRNAQAIGKQVPGQTAHAGLESLLEDVVACNQQRNSRSV